MKSDKKSIPVIENIISIVIIITGFSVAIYNSYYRNSVLEEGYRITIAQPTHITGGYKSGFLHFVFNYNTKKVESKNVINKSDVVAYGDSAFLNRRYFIKVGCSDGTVTELIIDVPVPDSLKQSLILGWPPEKLLEFKTIE